MITHNSVRETDPVTHSNSYVKAIIVFHVLVTVTYSNSYVKAIIVSTFWSATTKYLPQTNSVVRQEFSFLRISALTICHFYFIVAYNFLHTKHYSISDLFRIFLYSTKSNLVTFRWLLYSITIEICWNT